MTEADEAPEPAQESSVSEAPASETESPAAAVGEAMNGAASSEDEKEDRPLNGEGRERPGFLLEFPADPELERLVRAFETGNYEAVRVGAPRLAENTESAAVRAAARELRRRIDPDPLMKFLLAVAIALFVFVVWYTYQNHAH